MNILNNRPIIRHWRWFYDLLNYNVNCRGLIKEEQFLHYLRWEGMNPINIDKWFKKIIRSKKLIIVNDYGQRLRIVPEHFIYIPSSDIDEVMTTVKGRGAKQKNRFY